METVWDVILWLLQEILLMGEWIATHVRLSIMIAVAMVVAIFVLRLFVGLIKVFLIVGVVAVVTVLILSHLGV